MLKIKSQHLVIIHKGSQQTFRQGNCLSAYYR